jgi:glycerol-3-phosphate dehydrogenase
MRESLAELKDREFDVAVVGAGINGCAAAQELVAAGYSVLLVDKGDYGAGSSSRSTRLIHCGLRYLAPGGSPYSFLWQPKRLATAIRMTRQAMQARAEFVGHSEARTRRFTFGFPVWRGMAYKPWQIDLALRIVEGVGPKDVPLDRNTLSPDQARGHPLFAMLRDQDKLIGVNTYREYQFNWAERVATDMVLDARRMGAVCRNYTPVTGMERQADGRWALTLSDALGGDETATVSARMIVNTAGIWIDKVNRLASEDAPRKIFGTKGAHIVIRLPEECRDYGVISLNRKGEEPVYLVPWRQGLHYMAVTETVFEGDIDDIHADDADIRWLLDELNHLIPSLGLTEKDVLYTWAGVRPLTFDPAFPKGARSREIHDFSGSGLPNVVAMTAGPVTSHRSAGRELRDSVKARIQPSGQPQAVDYAPKPLAEDPSSPALLNHYDGISLADLRHAAQHEQVNNLRDLLARRTGIVWTESRGREGARQAAETVADILGWDEARIEREVADYTAYVDHTHRPPSGA